MLLIPPFPYLPLVDSLTDGTPVLLGGQDVSAHSDGAYTGEVSGDMLADWGCGYVLVGHSERRSLHGEDDTLVAAKFRPPRLPDCSRSCVSEKPWTSAMPVRPKPLFPASSRCRRERPGISAFARALVAYEPVWAIGDRADSLAGPGPVSSCINPVTAGR